MYLRVRRKTSSGSIKYLAGYYVLESGRAAIVSSGILGKLSELLPEYMVPVRVGGDGFVSLDGEWQTG